jgi:hypothetical protein
MLGVKASRCFLPHLYAEKLSQTRNGLYCLSLNFSKLKRLAGQGRKLTKENSDSELGALGVLARINSLSQRYGNQKFAQNNYGFPFQSPHVVSNAAEIPKQHEWRGNRWTGRSNRGDRVWMIIPQNSFTCVLRATLSSFQISLPAPSADRQVQTANVSETLRPGHPLEIQRNLYPTNQRIRDEIKR